MKIEIAQSRLKPALVSVAKFTLARAAIPVLEGILLEAAAGTVSLSAANIENGLSISIPAIVQEPGVIVLPKVAVDLIGGMTGDQVVLEMQGRTVKVKCGGSSATLNILDAAEFPTFPRLVENNPHQFRINAADLAQALGQVGFCASREEARPVLTGIYFQVTPDMLELAATDGFRLAIKKIGLEEGPANPFQALLPASGLARLSAILKDTPGMVRVDFHPPTQVVFSAEDWVYFSQTIHGNFPDIQSIIPSSHRHKIEIGSQPLSLALRQADVIARSNGHAVMLVPETTSESPALKVLAGSQEVGSSHIRLPSSGDLPKEGISVNCIFLRQIAEAIGSEKLEIGASTTKTPLTISPVGKNSITYIVMPIWQEQVSAAAKAAEASETSPA